MGKTIRIAVSVACLMAVAGCSVTGTWRTTSVVPEDYAQKFDFQAITFGDDDLYTASVRRDDQVTTTTGTYDWEPLFGKLELSPEQGNAQKYSAYLSFGKLVVKRQYDDETVKATLERVAE